MEKTKIEAETVPEDLTNETAYLINRPSDEAVSSRKAGEQPFCATIKRKQFREMQRRFKANIFYTRLEQAGIVAEPIYNPLLHPGFRKGFFQDDQPQTALIIFHKDQQILHDLMEEFVSRDFIKNFGWKKLKHYYVS